MSPISTQGNQVEKPYINGYESNQHSAHAEANLSDELFQHLPKLQQEILLLHGPRQKYSLETDGHIPDVRSEREILVQVSVHSAGRSIADHVGCRCGTESN